MSMPNAIKLKMGSLNYCSKGINSDRFPWILDDFSIELVSELWEVNQTKQKATNPEPT